MNALIDARPEWADKDTFEADRDKILRYGISIGLSSDVLLRITDPALFLGLWTAAEAAHLEE